MKNVWKGLTVGAFAGAAVGIVLDGFRHAADASARAATEVGHRAKSGASHLAEVVEEKIDDLDIKDVAESAKKGIDQAVDKGKDIAKTARKESKKAMKRGQKAANKGIDQAVERGKDIAETVKEGMEGVVDQGKKVLSKT